MFLQMRVFDFQVSWAFDLGFVARQPARGFAITPIDYLTTMLGVLLLFLIIYIVNNTFYKLHKRIEAWAQARFRVIKISTLEFTIPTRLTSSFGLLIKYLRTATMLAMLLLGLTFSLNIFPETRGIVWTLYERVAIVLGMLLEKLLAFLPNLIAVVVIAVIARYTLKLLAFLSEGVRQKKIKISGVHPDLIDPTLQLLRFLVIALAIVTAYPYVPGSDSPVFRGVSIFVGFLLSLGSTSLVANIISGIVLTYTRGLKIGDRVQIADAVGDVIDRNLLVTRVRTIKNVIITIPNGMVLSNHIINYSASAEENGLILNTTVTIGYDAPWRQVRQLLIEAALDTPGILESPAPFVFQTSLDDYYVSYELNAYTKQPSRMAEIYSLLHQNIQDHFNEAGVEIMSPAYSAWRDGNQSTIPSPIPAARPSAMSPQTQTFGPQMAALLHTLAPHDTRPRPK
jgi:small-conductance mechanosensitive channel